MTRDSSSTSYEPPENPHVAMSRWYAKRWAEWNAKRENLMRQIEAQEKELGADHLDMTTAYSELGSLELEDDGYFTDFTGGGPDRKARQNFLRAVEIVEKHQGLNHPDLVIHYRNLASVEDIYSKAEARRLYLRAIEIAEEHFGVNHPSLSILYSELGDFEEECDVNEGIRLKRKAYLNYHQRSGKTTKTSEKPCYDAWNFGDKTEQKELFGVNSFIECAKDVMLWLIEKDPNIESFLAEHKVEQEVLDWLIESDSDIKLFLEEYEVEQDVLDWITGYYPNIKSFLEKHKVKHSQDDAT